MSLPKRSGSLQLLAYLCPALVLWTHAGSANVKHMIPIFLALSYELACTRRSLALGDNGLILNTMRVAEKTYPSILSQMENADAALETVKQNLKLKKKAEFARKKAIRNPCTVPDCKKKATYAYRYGEADRCEDHRGDRKKQYRVCTCGKAQPSYHFPDEISAAYCASCKKKDMVNIVSRRCVCNRCQPSFNYPDEDTPMCCINCMEEGMVHVGRDKCECGNSVPKYAEPGESKARCCHFCRTETMINIANQMCITCKVTCAAYNVSSERKPLYCGKCKLPGMERLSLKRCPGMEGSCTRYWNSKFRGYCAHCFVNTFPNDPMSFTIRQKSKENKVRDYINANFKGFSHDQSLYTAHCDCTVRRRLDHFKLIGNTIFAIETDENQHKSYDQMNEEMRYNDLYMAHSGRWVYIRFNPDTFKDKKGATRDPPMPDRLAALGEEMKRQIARITERGDVTPDAKEQDLVEIVYMYYDGYM